MYVSTSHKLIMDLAFSRHLKYASLWCIFQILVHRRSVIIYVYLVTIKQRQFLFIFVRCLQQVVRFMTSRVVYLSVELIARGAIRNDVNYKVHERSSNETDQTRRKSRETILFFFCLGHQVLI
jgi:hypothetical protein